MPKRHLTTTGVRVASGSRNARLAITVFLWIVVFSPTINVLSLEYRSIQLWAAVVAGWCGVVLFCHYRITRPGLHFAIGATAAAAGATVLMILVGTGWVSPVKIASGIFLALVTSVIVNYHPQSLVRFTVTAFLVNLVFVVLQVTGAAEFAYAFEDYANQADPVNLFERSRFLGQVVVVGYLPQLRPAGLFPSPTYLSVFCVFLWHQLVVNPAYTNRRVLFGVGCLFVLVGSTVGLFLSLASVLFLPRKRAIAFFVLGAVAAFYLYAELAPYQFAYNFTVSDFVRSFAQRVGVASRASRESLLQQQPIVLAAGCLAFALVVLLSRRIGVAPILRIGIGLGLPVMVHNVSASLLYWLMVALVASELFVLRFVAQRGRRPALTVHQPPDIESPPHGVVVAK
jgi:hypothetical protein